MVAVTDNLPLLGSTQCCHFLVQRMGGSLEKPIAQCLCQSYARPLCHTRPLCGSSRVATAYMQRSAILASRRRASNSQAMSLATASKHTP
jgi:hypothetical protein